MGLDRSVTLATKVTEEAAGAIRAAAERARMTVSDYLRGSALVHMAFSGDGYAVRAFLQGAVRAGAEVGQVLLGWIRERGWGDRARVRR